MVRHFRELRIYRKAVVASQKLFELSKQWPSEEKYGLADQARRASRSVCLNIAEAWRKRRYEKHFIGKLSDADAEVAETQSTLDFAVAAGYVTREDYDVLNGEYEEIFGGLVKMMNHAEDWCNPGREIRENQAEYFTSDDTPTPPCSQTSILDDDITE